MAAAPGTEVGCLPGESRHLLDDDTSLTQGKCCRRCGKVLSHDPRTGDPFLHFEAHSEGVVDGEAVNRGGLANTPSRYLGSTVHLFSRRDFRASGGSERARLDLDHLRHNLLITGRMDKQRGLVAWLEDGRRDLLPLVRSLGLDESVVEDAVHIARDYRLMPRKELLRQEAVWAACLSLACYQRKLWLSVDSLFPLLGIREPPPPKLTTKSARAKKEKRKTRVMLKREKERAAAISVQCEARRDFYLARKTIARLLHLSYDPFGNGEALIQYYVSRAGIGPVARKAAMTLWAALMEKSKRIGPLLVMPEDLREAEAARGLMVLAMRFEKRGDKAQVRRLLGVTQRTECRLVARLNHALGEEVVLAAFHL